MIWRKLLVYLCPLVSFLATELAYRYYNTGWLYIFPSLGLFFLLITIKAISKEKIFSRDFFYLALLPVLLIVTMTIFGLLPVPAAMLHLILALAVVFLYLYLDNTFLLYYLPAKYKLNALENLSSVLNLLVFFLSIINLNALNTFLNLALWQLSLLLVLINSLLIMQSFWSNRFNDRIRYVFLLIINVVIVEFFWALSFLPMNFFTNSIILTLIYYIIWGLLKAKFTQTLDKKIIWRYLLISLLLLIVIIITSTWI